MLQRSSKRYLIGCGATAIVCTACLLYVGVSCGQRQGVDGKQCPVVVAYIPGASGPLKVYSEMSGERDAVNLKNPNANLTLLGYLKEQNAWIFKRLERGGDYRVFKLTDGVESRIPFDDLPDEADLGSTKMCGDYLYIPFARGNSTNVTLIRYSPRGAMLWCRELIQPQKAGGSWRGMDVSGDGRVAVAIESPQSSEEPYVYVFNKNGHAGKCLGRGSWPVFNRDGRRLAYKETIGRTDNIVIVDLPTGSRRTISTVIPSALTSLVPQVISEGITLGSVGGFLRCRWDPGGNWLVCAYSRVMTGGSALFCVDISSKELTWQHTPVSAGSNQWIVLDGLPSSLAKPVAGKP